jgi:hypothetical protein
MPRRSPTSYSVSRGTNWLNLSGESGPLAPGATAQVTVAINSNVNHLQQGTYRDTVHFTNTTNGRGTTSRPVEVVVGGEEQHWQVFLSGYEIDEMNPYWKITTKVRGAVRFDFKLRGQFVLRKVKGKWTYKGGAITLADVGLSSLYQPVEVWLLKPFACSNCSDVAALKGRALSGTLADGSVRLYWGKVVPTVTVHAKIVVSCIPMPKCAEWGQRLFKAERFFDRVNYVPLPLVHEGTVQVPPQAVGSPRRLALDQRCLHAEADQVSLSG